MTKIDIEAIARETELIEPRDVWADLPADYRQALCSFAALVLEKAAQVCDGRESMDADWCAQDIRAMAAGMGD